MKKKRKKIFLQQKKRRYLNKIFGTQEKPRLSVFKSHNHIYAQLIDDQNGHTLVSSSTLDKQLKTDLTSTNTKIAAFSVGERLATKAVKQAIKKVVFDRGNKTYHGKIKSLADGARQQGLVF